MFYRINFCEKELARRRGRIWVALVLLALLLSVPTVLGLRLCHLDSMNSATRDFARAARPLRELSARMTDSVDALHGFAPLAKHLYATSPTATISNVCDALQACGHDVRPLTFALGANGAWTLECRHVFPAPLKTGGFEAAATATAQAVTNRFGSVPNGRYAPLWPPQRRDDGRQFVRVRISGQLPGLPDGSGQQPEVFAGIGEVLETHQREIRAEFENREGEVKYLARTLELLRKPINDNPAAEAERLALKNELNAGIDCPAGFLDKLSRCLRDTGRTQDARKTDELRDAWRESRAGAAWSIPLVGMTLYLRWDDSRVAAVRHRAAVASRAAGLLPGYDGIRAAERAHRSLWLQTDGWFTLGDHKKEKKDEYIVEGILARHTVADVSVYHTRELKEQTSELFNLIGWNLETGDVEAGDNTQTALSSLIGVLHDIERAPGLFLFRTIEIEFDPNSPGTVMTARLSGVFPAFRETEIAERTEA